MQMIYGIELFLSKRIERSILFQNEFWKEVRSENKKYFVSSLGRVKSCDSYFKNPLTKKGLSIKKGKFLKLWIDKEYLRCGISVYSDNERRRFVSVHRLVLETFEGSSDLQCNHKNGNKKDNRLINLEYCTPKENVQHSISVLKKQGFNKKKILDSETGVFYDSFSEAYLSTNQLIKLASFRKNINKGVNNKFIKI